MNEMIIGMKSGLTKMMKQIKALREMETVQKCSVQRDEIIIPLHQNIDTTYIHPQVLLRIFLYICKMLGLGFFATFFVRLPLLTERK